VGPYRQALIADGIPLAQLAVDDVRAEVERLRDRGVTIVQEPMDIGMAIVAVFDDTCGNIIQLLEAKAGSGEAE
jgi:predicted enzyme related to lactoylglutathione lyase